MNLSLEGVGLVHANGHQALRWIDLHVEAGERVALIGASGAGKTTLLRVLAAALRPSPGRSSLRAVARTTPGSTASTRARSRISQGVLPKTPGYIILPAATLKNAITGTRWVHITVRECVP